MALNYIDDFGGIAGDHHTATHHFHMLQSLLLHLGLKEAAHKASPPAQVMTWLGLQFDTIEMSVTIPLEKLQDTLRLVEDCVGRQAANIHQLRVLLGKLLHIAQCCQSARLFLNCMFATLRDCPGDGTIQLSAEFKKDLQWFRLYATSSNGVSIIDEDVRQTVDIFVDACTTSCGALCGDEAYHTTFPQHTLDQCHPICELEALNAAAAIKLWAPTLVGRKVRLYSDSSTAVAIIQADKGRNGHIQACVREIWLSCAIHGITLTCTHTSGDSLISTADALGRCHLGGVYQNRVHQLVR